MANAFDNLAVDEPTNEGVAQVAAPSNGSNPFDV